MPERLDVAAYEAGARGITRLVEANPGTDVAVVHDGWPESALDGIPDGVDVSEMRQWDGTADE